MKKLFSLLLVLAMVLSMSLAAADSAETIKIGVIAYGSRLRELPFWASS